MLKYVLQTYYDFEKPVILPGISSETLCSEYRKSLYVISCAHVAQSKVLSAKHVSSWEKLPWFTRFGPAQERKRAKAKERPLSQLRYDQGRFLT